MGKNRYLHSIFQESYDQKMALTLGQVQKQVQRLVMTPQMQQSIKLLQLNTMELEQLTDQQMLENPFLELRDDRESSTQDPENIDAMQSGDSAVPQSLPESADRPVDPEIEEARTKDLEKEPEAFDRVDVDWEEAFSDSENKVYYQREKYEEHDFTEYTSLPTSLTDELLRQIRLSSLEGEDVAIGEYMVGCINENGYFTSSLEDVAARFQVTPERVEDVLDVIQCFDPPGIAARDLAECLRLQLEDQNVRDSFIYRLIDEHLEDLQRKKFREIAKAMNVDEERVMRAFRQISRLEPKPGRAFTREGPQYITPDVIVKKFDGKYIYFLNEGRSAHLTINNYYRNLLSNSHMSKTDKAFAIEKYKGAVWLLKNIEKRKSTILRITEVIMNTQRGFLEKGVKHLKPLTLREVVEEVEMHESTVARVTSSKYVETPRGIFRLKYFFSSGLETREGESTSSTSVKDTIRGIIESEPATKPYSDQKIARMLSEKGIKIARRTVAKYRDQMKILPAKLRKKTTLPK